MWSRKRGVHDECLDILLRMASGHLEFTWKKTPGTKDCFALGRKVEIGVLLMY